MLSLGEVAKQSGKDHFQLWPICVALAGPILFHVMYAFWDGSDGILLIFVIALLVWYGSAVLILLWLAFLVAQGRSQRAISFAALPVIAFLLLWWRDLLAPVDWGAAYARFLVHRAEYRAEVARLEARNGAPVIACFPWLAYGFPGATGEIAVVYDASDEIARPFGQQSPAWRDRACSDLKPDPHEGRALPFTAQHLDGHYYLANISFD